MALTCVKTALGEDLIGDVTIHDDMLEIESPLMIMIVPTQQGQYSVGLAPYMIFSANKKFSFPKNHIVLLSEPADQLRNDYNRITGKGIVVPKSKIELVP
jgi:hypothetical protein